MMENGQRKPIETVIQKPDPPKVEVKIPDYASWKFNPAILEMKAQAEMAPNYTKKCIICGHKVFYVDDTKGRIEGHVYSRNGMKEYQISGCCEYCYDNLFPEDEE